ncbi:hypothetical protein ONS95_012286 [Cadophora gregata]|uniref:uncharacterized protein n=1 Tax=Cadophora gregata TaxID=51156 RepID=UPI0026DAB408|nr:uncharacterized protein ONS95_012286 [Cadophora gregata]KAK0117975.1 hypothetical protein ONS95_012286 [Cadophora gregata]KAK0123039.1 hypothetical protein ONS96_010049 [Cadophora gregata f. sp. sojae]
MARRLLALMTLAIGIAQALATDPLGICKDSGPRTCSGNDLEQLFIANGPITTLDCNFTLSATLDGTTMFYAIISFTPTNQRYPVPFSSFTPTNENPIVKFSLRDKKISTVVAPYPDIGLEGEKYREILLTYKDLDQYGSSNVFLLNGLGNLGLMVEVEGRMKWQCIDGTVALVLVAPEGRNFITDSGAFQRPYPGPLLIDNAFGGRLFSSGGIFKKIDVVVHIVSEE